MKVIISVLFLAAVAYADLQCPTAQENDWSIELLLTHADCDKFYKCTYGQPVEQNCYNGLWFNVATWQCDWPANVDCGDRNVPGEDKSDEVIPEPEEEVPEPEVEPKPEPKPQPEEEQETVEEEEEAVEEEEEAVEEEEEAVEEEEEAVEEEAVEEECEEEEVEEPEPVLPEIEFQKNGCPVNPHVHWLLPHEKECNKFYYCVWGEKVPRECASTLHFNRELQVCDWPTAAGCTISADKHYASRVAFRNMM